MYTWQLKIGEFVTHGSGPNKKLAKQVHSIYILHLYLLSSVVDPYHYDLDPDLGKADPDPNRLTGIKN